MKIIEAAHFAKMMHYGQTRYGGLTPYITHPAAVAGMVTLSPIASEETISAAWLHDVVEDTDATIAEIRLYFGDNVAFLIESLTNIFVVSNPKYKGIKRAERKAMEFERLHNIRDSRVHTIKLLDRVHNLQDMDAFPAKLRTTYIKESRYLYDALDLAFQRKLLLQAIDRLTGGDSLV